MKKPTLRFKNLSNGVVVCDNRMHYYSRMSQPSAPKKTYVGTAPCHCNIAGGTGKASRWQEA